MSILDQSVPPPMEPSVLSQQLDMPQVDLPPEDSANLSRIVPELDLLGEKSKDKEDSEEEEVSACFDLSNESLQRGFIMNTNSVHHLIQ